MMIYGGTGARDVKICVLDINWYVHYLAKTTVERFSMERVERGKLFGRCLHWTASSNFNGNNSADYNWMVHEGWIHMNEMSEVTTFVVVQ